ncbi:MAG: helix-turn-helix transcriptional regulator, partial [Clostridium sp.]
MAKDTYYILVKLIDFDIKSIFRLDRIVQFNETSNTYIIEKDFNIKEYFKHSFEIEVGKEIFDFKLEFYNEGVFNAIERNWFEDQSVILIDKNKAIFEGKTNSEVELTKWILGYGEKVKVIEPIWLREKIKNKYKNALSLYGV